MNISAEEETEELTIETNEETVQSDSSKLDNNDQNNVITKPSKDKEDTEDEPEETEELIAKGKMQTSIFSKYFRTGNSYFLLVSAILFFVLAQILRSGSDYWLAYW